MFIPIFQLRQFDPQEARQVRDRWESKEGQEYLEYIRKLIREGAGQHFLQSDFEQSKFGDFLKDEWDLRGFQFWKEDIDFPKRDNFFAIDFSYSKFWDSKLKNCLFHAGFSFSRFYNCEFINCQFSLAYFLGCSFEKCVFENIDFMEECLFNNCQFEDTKFINFFMPDRLFMDCSFSSTVEITKPSPTAIDTNWNLIFDNKYLSDFYRSLHEAYKAGGVIDNEWDCFYKARQASTRYNSKNLPDKYVKLIFNEYLIGYGERPSKCLTVSVLVIILFAFLNMFNGLAFPVDNLSGNMEKVINYDWNISYFIKNVNKSEYIWLCTQDYFDFLFYSIVTFTTFGYVNITPINPIGRFLSAAEMLLGLTLLGAWVATLFRKLTR